MVRDLPFPAGTFSACVRAVRGLHAHKVHELRNCDCRNGCSQSAYHNVYRRVTCRRNAQPSAQTPDEIQLQAVWFGGMSQYVRASNVQENAQPSAQTLDEVKLQEYVVGMLGKVPLFIYLEGVVYR